jgi:hypothetical protein
LQGGHVFGPNVYPIIIFLFIQYKYCMMLVDFKFHRNINEPEGKLSSRNWTIWNFAASINEIMTSSFRTAYNFQSDSLKIQIINICNNCLTGDSNPGPLGSKSGMLPTKPFRSDLDNYDRFFYLQIERKKKLVVFELFRWT